MSSNLESLPYFMLYEENIPSLETIRTNPESICFIVDQKYPSPRHIIQDIQNVLNDPISSSSIKEEEQVVIELDTTSPQERSDVLIETIKVKLEPFSLSDTDDSVTSNISPCHLDDLWSNDRTGGHSTVNLSRKRGRPSRKGTYTHPIALDPTHIVIHHYTEDRLVRIIRYKDSIFFHSCDTFYSIIRYSENIRREIRYHLGDDSKELLYVGDASARSMIYITLDGLMKIIHYRLNTERLGQNILFDTVKCHEMISQLIGYCLYPNKCLPYNPNR